MSSPQSLGHGFYGVMQQKITSINSRIREVAATIYKSEVMIMRSNYKGSKIKCWQSRRRGNLQGKRCAASRARL